MTHHDRRSPLRSVARSHLIALEPRMMFDAAMAATTDAVASAAAAERQAPEAHHADMAPIDAFHAPVERQADIGGSTHDRAVVAEPAAADAGSHEVIFIDTAVADYAYLAQTWSDRGQVVLIDSRSDGVDQMRAALAGRSDVTAIHIVSHGSEGVLYLGTTRIDDAAITGDLAASLGAIGRTLTADGDILIYGCDFAEGDAGARAIADLARATGADIAASTDLTGYAPRGGDWDLEAHRGQVEARSLDGGDGWHHTLAPNDPVPISVTADSLVVTYQNRTIVSGDQGYDGQNRSADVGQGAVATWKGAATVDNRSVDLVATVVALSTGDAIRFNRPGVGANGDDATFLLRDLTQADAASVQIRWSLVDSTTGEALPADVRFTIADIDGIGGNPNTRETVSTPTTDLAYYTHEQGSDIRFGTANGVVTASGTEDENTDPNAAVTPKSAATFDWSDVSAFTLTYTLETNAVRQAQFYQDGNARFDYYADPVYVSIPRLDLDADDSTATGADAHFTFTEGDPAIRIVDTDISVVNPMPEGTPIIGGTVTLTNAKPGDTFIIGTLPTNVTATIGAGGAGTITVTLAGDGSEADYAAAIKAISFRNTSDAIDGTTRVIQIAFRNDTLISNVATSRITVVPVNDAPDAVNDVSSTPEDTARTIAVLANDTDPDNDALTVTAASALHGTVVINADGTITYTPDANYNGRDTISYSISDGHGGTDSATVAMTVTAVNDAPSRVGTLPDRSGQDADQVSYATAGAFGDVDGDTLRYSASGLPAGLSIDQTSGVISGTIDRSASQTGGGAYRVVVTAADPSGAATTQAFALTVTNPPPVARDDTASTAEDVPVTFAVLGNDSDPDGDPLTVTAATAQHGQVVINNDNTLTYTPDADYVGQDVVRYTISDGQGGTDTASVAVTISAVDDPPVAVGTFPDQSGRDAAAVSIDTTPGFRDPDGDTLTYSATGLPAGFSIDTRTGVITGTFGRSASQANGGRYPITVTATDPQGGSATQRFDLVATNPAPTPADDAASTDEDRSVVIDVLGNDSDPDGDPLTVIAAAADHGTVAINPDGTLGYTPDADYNGTDTIRYTVSDGEGGTGDAIVTVDVRPVEDAPVASGTLPDRTADDGASVSYPTAGGFRDVDGDTLRYTATGLPAGLAIDRDSGVISGPVDRSASQVGGGVYAVVVTATDGSGESATQRFTISVDNPPPVARDDDVTVHVDTPATIVVLGNDSDPDGDPLTVTQASADRGTVSINPDGTLAYAPPAGYQGAVTIAYTIADGQGGTSDAVVHVTVTNAAPVATAIPDRSASDADAVSVPVAGSFSDADGDILTYSATGLPPGLVIDRDTGVVSGTVDRSASQTGGGVYVATITANDGHGATADATMRWTIANPAPTAADDSATTPEDTPVTIDVLRNDSDPDGDPLTVIAAAADHGTVAINPDGTLAYTPDRDYNGTDTIRYTISDGQGGRDDAVVTVTVTPVNDAPVAVGTQPDQTRADGEAVSLPTAGWFTDVDGDRLTYAATGLPAGLAIDAAGVIAGTIDRSASQAGPYAVIVTATDPSGGAATQRLTIAVVNPPPVASDNVGSVHAGSPIVVDVLANDRDPDGDPLTVIAAAADHGRVTIGADGRLTYVSDPTFIGTDVIRYTVSDGQGGAADAVARVTTANAAPTAGAIAAQAADDGASVTVPTAAAFADADGDTLTYSASGLPAGLVIDRLTGVVSGTIDRSASQAGGGVYDAIITADDGHGATASTIMRWTIANPAPIARDDSATAAEDRTTTITVLGNDTDPDGDPLTVTGATAQHGRVVVNPDGTLSYTPDADYDGPDEIRYTISDAQGGTSEARVAITVSAVNDAPTTTGLPPRTTADNGAVSIPTAQAFADRDPGDMLTYSATGLPAGLTIDPVTGVISGTIAPGAAYGGPAGDGRYTVVVTATDRGGLTADAPFAWTVDPVAPVARDDAYTIAEDFATTLDVLANDSDGDGDPLTIVAVGATHGTATIVGGAIRFVPDADYHGPATVTYTISDPAGNRATAVATITVTSVNDAPVARTIPDTAARDADTVALDLAGFFSDGDGDMLAYSATGLPAGLSIDPASGRIGGTIDRSASQAGPYQVVVTATDPSGAAASSRFTWAIANPAPVATDDRAITAEDRAVTIPVLANDADPDGDPLTVIAAEAGHGRVTINPDGTIAYTPDTDYNGQDLIVYTVSDGQGGRATASVLVTVTAVPDAPIANDDVATTQEDVAIDIAVLANDRDPDGDPLTVIAAQAGRGRVTVNPDGTLHYVPAADFNGTDTIRYTIADGQGGTATATVTIRVTPVEDVPVAAPGTARTDEDRPVTITPPVTDRDGDPLTVTDAGAQHGRVVRNPDGTITYTPDADYNGPDTITYTVSDGQGGTTTGTIAVTVDPVADAPTALRPVEPARDALEGDRVTIPAAPWFRDADGGGLTYAATGLPAGLAIDPATGVISGTIGNRAAGSYDIVVTASDAAGRTAETVLTLRITDPAPVAGEQQAVTAEDRGVIIPVLDGVRDPDGDPLTIVTAGAKSGSVTINPDGTITYVPGPDFAGQDVVTYTVSDGQGGVTTGTVTVTVTPVNDAPVIPVQDRPIDAIGGRPVRIDPLAGVVDPDGDRPVLTGATSANGSVLVQPDGTLLFTPALGFVGNATISYTVTDGQGGTATGTLVVRVADGRGADIEQLLAFGRPAFHDPAPALAVVRTADGIVRNPLSIRDTVAAIRSLRGTAIAPDRPVTGAVEDLRTLRGTDIDPDQPITAEVAALIRRSDFRDAGDRLFDQRWGDFLVKGLTGFSAAADPRAGVMIESVVRGGAIYVEVRDTAPDRPAIRQVEVRAADGGPAPDWIRVDGRGLAIVERAADRDELHLIVRITRADGARHDTPVVIQGSTGEIELDRQPPGTVRARAAPLDATVHAPRAAAHAAAARLTRTFE